MQTETEQIELEQGDGKQYASTQPLTHTKGATSKSSIDPEVWLYIQEVPKKCQSVFMAKNYNNFWDPKIIIIFSKWTLFYSKSEHGRAYIII